MRAKTTAIVVIAFTLLFISIGIATILGRSDYQKVTIATHRAVGSPPVWVALEEGFFKARGLDVKLVELPTASLSTQALTGGGADFAGASSISVFKLASERGIYLKLVHPTLNNLPGSAQLVARKGLDVTALEGLKGKTIGVDEDGTGCLECFTFLLQLAENGLAANEDVHITRVVHQHMADALEQGVIDAATMIQPYAAFAISQGKGYSIQDERLGELGDASVKVFGTVARILEEGEPSTVWLATSAYWTTEEYLERNPDTVRRVAAAIADASKWLMIPANVEKRSAILIKYVGGLGNPDLFKTAADATLSNHFWIPYPDGYTDWKALQHQAQKLEQFDYLQEVPDVKLLVATPWFLPE